MEKSIFHKLLVMMVFEDENFDPDGHARDAWEDWLDEAGGSLRCVVEDWNIEDIDPNEKEIIISFSGYNAKHGGSCGGTIFASFDGEVRSVDPM